jgi:palmitoyltransferase
VLLAHRVDEPVATAPHFASIIIGSLIWVFYAWATRLVICKSGHPCIFLTHRGSLSATPGHALGQLGFFASFAFCTWSFYKAIRTDPGFVPGPEGDSDVKMVRRTLLRREE